MAMFDETENIQAPPDMVWHEVNKAANRGRIIFEEPGHSIVAVGSLDRGYNYLLEQRTDRSTDLRHIIENANRVQAALSTNQDFTAALNELAPPTEPPSQSLIQILNGLFLAVLLPANEGEEQIQQIKKRAERKARGAKWTPNPVAVEPKPEVPLAATPPGEIFNGIREAEAEFTKTDRVTVLSMSDMLFDAVDAAELYDLWPEVPKQEGPEVEAMLKIAYNRRDAAKARGARGAERFFAYAADAILELILTAAAEQEPSRGKQLISTERAQVGWGFWLWWVLASSVGLAVSVVGVLFVFAALVIGAGEAFEPSVVFGYVLLAVGGAVMGASVGIAQWLVLRRQVSWAGRWVLASTVGMAVGQVLSGAVSVGEGYVMFGASVGIAQWLVLRRRVSQAGWWVLASTMCFAVFLAVAFDLSGALDIDTALLGAVIGALLAILFDYGAITGGVMVWLLRQPVSEEPSLPQDAA